MVGLAVRQRYILQLEALRQIQVGLEGGHRFTIGHRHGDDNAIAVQHGGIGQGEQVAVGLRYIKSRNDDGHDGMLALKVGVSLGHVGFYIHLVVLLAARIDVIADKYVFAITLRPDYVHIHICVIHRHVDYGSFCLLLLHSRNYDRKGDVFALDPARDLGHCSKLIYHIIIAPRNLVGILHFLAEEIKMQVTFALNGYDIGVVHIINGVGRRWCHWLRQIDNKLISHGIVAFTSSSYHKVIRAKLGQIVRKIRFTTIDTFAVNDDFHVHRLFTGVINPYDIITIILINDLTCQFHGYWDNRDVGLTCENHFSVACVFDGGTTGVIACADLGLNDNRSAIEVFFHSYGDQNHLVVVAGSPLDGTIGLILPIAVGIPVTKTGKGRNDAGLLGITREKRSSDIFDSVQVIVALTCVSAHLHLYWRQALRIGDVHLEGVDIRTERCLDGNHDLLTVSAVDIHVIDVKIAVCHSRADHEQTHECEN